jgi:hypothetical protein
MNKTVKTTTRRHFSLPSPSPQPPPFRSLASYPTISVAVGVRIPPGAVLHPVVTVTVWVGMTQPVVQVGHCFLVTVLVGVLGQQSVLAGQQDQH